MSFPRGERGYFHLTPGGWVRRDSQPFPPGRLETWQYEMNCEADDAKEQVFLIRVWRAPASDRRRSALRSLYGEPIQPSVARNVTLECQV